MNNIPLQGEKKMQANTLSKRLLALLLAVLSLLLTVSCGNGQDKDKDNDSLSAANSDNAPSEEKEEEKALMPFGVYYLVNDKGQKIGHNSATPSLALDLENESKCRITVYFRTCEDGKKHYMFYEGDDTTKHLNSKISKVGEEIAYYANNGAGKGSCFDLIPSADGSSYKIVNAANPELCITYNDKGKAVYASSEDDSAANYWKIEPAAPSEAYIPFTSKDGHIVLRIPEKFTTRKAIGFNAKLAQKWVDYFEEAYYYEIELTGYVPYDVIVIKAYEDENIVAGVVNNYNVITADVGFMESELSNVAKRYTKHNVMEIGFGMLHEMGHMFDSGRGWNFESEAWTDLKLCYCLKRLGEKYPDVVFTATPAGYDASKYFTYDTMVECLGQHDNETEGGMTKVYAFFGCAKIFLIIANDIGWEPYVQTFHWFQDNNVLEESLKREERFYKFVEKLSEFSGKDIRSMIDEINPKAWGVMDDYFSGKTNKAI